MLLCYFTTSICLFSSWRSKNFEILLSHPNTPKYLIIPDVHSFIPTTEQELLQTEKKGKDMVMTFQQIKGRRAFGNALLSVQYSACNVIFN